MILAGKELTELACVCVCVCVHVCACGVCVWCACGVCVCVCVCACVLRALRIMYVRHWRDSNFLSFSCCYFVNPVLAKG